MRKEPLAGPTNKQTQIERNNNTHKLQEKQEETANRKTGVVWAGRRAAVHGAALRRGAGSRHRRLLRTPASVASASEARQVFSSTIVVRLLVGVGAAADSYRGNIGEREAGSVV